MAGGHFKVIRALAITGPTASGKTAASLAVAQCVGAEIISCDSMQIYKGMNIGTAKATRDEQAAVPHHLIDIISPSEQYSAEDYRRDAIAAAESDGADHVRRLLREKLSFDHMKIVCWDQWRLSGSKKEAVRKWIDDCRRFGVEARCETTDRADFSKYCRKLLLSDPTRRIR
jgi:hypothetical protein